MKRFLAALLAAALVLPALVEAQAPGAIVQQSPVHLDACSQTFTATGAANTAVTVTAPALTSQFFYICSITILETANAAVTGAAGPAPIFTTTNLLNQLVWWGDNSSLTIGALVKVTDVVYPNPLKSTAAGVATTIVTSAGQATQSVRLSMTGYYGNQ